jgi:hypothetical protein
VSCDIDDVERLLRARRVTPRAEFVGELERSLLRASASKPACRRVRVLVAGSGLAAGLATVAVVLAVAGLLPFTSSAGRAEAGEHCTNARVAGMQRRPYFVRDHEGTVQVRYGVELVPRLVRRCR